MCMCAHMPRYLCINYLGKDCGGTERQLGRDLCRWGKGTGIKYWLEKT